MSAALPDITERQKRLALSLASAEHARRYRGKSTDIVHFIVATTRNGWQVLRHYYLYAVYRYRRLQKTDFAEVMQQWFKDGQYVFLSRNRQGMTYSSDSWCLSTPMTIKRGSMSTSCLLDPRDLGYTKVYYARLQKRFSYIPKDDKCEYRVDDMFNALNTHPFNETLFRQHPEEWKWSVKSGFAFDREKTSAIKVAIRHGYDIKSIEWRDLVEMLKYLRKDLHNPKLVCPDNLKAAHDMWSALAARKRRKCEERMMKANQVRMEREQLRRMEYEARREEERKEAAKAAVTLYPKARSKFFGLVIAENELEIKVLQSVAEFMEEGIEMKHCVFANGYYDVKKKPYSLILSAKVNGERAETIEVDLKDYRVVQCRGKSNQPTEYHDEIMRLMGDHMPEIQQLNTARK